MNPPLPFTGGCVCGAVRYEVTAAPSMLFQCHCRDCQRVTGGASLPGLLVPVASFRLTQGTLKFHLTPSLAGGHHKRGFCADCGSRLTGVESDTEAKPFIGITAGSLDDPSWFKPQIDFFVSDAQPWDRMDPETTKFDLYPPKPR